MRPLEALPAVPAAVLFFYLFFRPGADPVACAAVLALWLASMAADLRSTLARGRLIARHERSALLRRLYARLPGRRAAVLCGAAESASVALLPAAVLLEADLGASSAVAFLFACLHAQAVLDNDGFEPRQGRPTS